MKHKVTGTDNKRGYSHSLDFASTTPQTDIIARIKKATPKADLLPKVEIGPLEAADILSLTETNRLLTWKSIHRYTKDMKKKRWMFNGEVIQLDWNMQLRNGQHRLIAVIKSGMSIVVNIQCGLDPASFATMDSGKNRNAADILSIDGFNNANAMAQAIKGDIYFTRQHSVGARINRETVSNMEISEWIDKNPRNVTLMKKCVEHAHRFLYRKNKALSLGSWSFIYYTLCKRDVVDATKFVELLATGENISTTKNAAIYLLREKLLNIKNDQQGKSMDLKVRYIVTAWNYYRQNKKPTELKIDAKKMEIDEPI